MREPRRVLRLEPMVVALIVWAWGTRPPCGAGGLSSSVSVSALVQEDGAAQAPHKAWEWGGAVTQRETEERRQPHPLSFSVAQPTWRPSFPTSPVVSSSTPSSTWVPSGSSRCSSQTRPSCRASCSSASSQVRGRGDQGTREGVRRGRPGAGQALLCRSGVAGWGVKSSVCEARGAPPLTS